MDKFQIVREGSETWLIWSYIRLYDEVVKWERLGRVVKGCDGLYYAEIAKHLQNTVEWQRQPRGYQLPDGAWWAIIRPRRRVKWTQ
jgi:hypothetical protein